MNVLKNKITKASMNQIMGRFFIPVLFPTIVIGVIIRQPTDLFFQLFILSFFHFLQPKASSLTPII